jgi:hypothetical protein
VDERAAYGELTVLRTPEPLAKRPRKRVRTQEPEREQPERRCESIAVVDIAELGLSVEMKRRTVTRGARVLLGTFTAEGVRWLLMPDSPSDTSVLTVVDWIDEVETILAARDAVMQMGGDVVGVSVVVAAGGHLLQILKAAQIPYSCAWIPPFGGELAIGSRRAATRSASDGPRCICHQPRNGFKASGIGEESDRAPGDTPKRPPPRLAHFTAQYQVGGSAMGDELLPRERC